MPFTLIKGRFKPQAGFPDGDSVRFMADDLSLWLQLEGRRVNLGTGRSTKNTVQLRFEGIDSIEKAAIKPLSTQSRDNMLKLIDFDPDSNTEPQGFILSRATDSNAGRPVSFVFAGETSLVDGSSVFLDPEMMQNSVNYKQVLEGFAYPLYYETLFADLRNQFNQGLEIARMNQSGYWPTDATLTGVTVNSKEDLSKIPPIWPKLWRRLEEYASKSFAINSEGSFSLENFIDFLKEKNERIDIISTTDRTGLHNVVEVTGNQVKLLQPPENIRVVG
jgi:hypothetical protein